MPIPLDTDFFSSYLVKDVPDNIKLLSCLPLSIRRILIRLLPNNFKIVGPLFSPGDNDSEVDSNILRVFSKSETRPKVFCTMGSSGTKQQLLEVIKALVSKEGSSWNAFVLVLPAICPLDEALSCAGNRKGLYITDSFVPAPLVNALADVVICHGGQGTVQTALASGTPMVGVAMQPEQQINLDNVVLSGAGIRIPINRWTSANIVSATKKLIKNPSYTKKAK